MRKRNLLEALLFAFSPIHNPFFAVMWRQQRRNIGQFLFHLGLMLGFVWLVFAAASFIMEARDFAVHHRGIVLYELVAWSHFIAASVYSTSLYRRYRQFWREDTRPQLLLTGAPPVWIALAIPIYPLFIQAYIALLCLPFYAAAATLSGIAWSTVMLTIAPIVLLTGLHISWAGWLILPFALRGVTRVSDLALWSNLPFLLQSPVRFYIWSTPVWILLPLAIPLALAHSATQWAWWLEPRFYPTQAKVWQWSNRFGFLLHLFFWGLVWAYVLPADFEAKVAYTLVAFRLAISASILSQAFVKQETTPPIPPTKTLVASMLTLNLLTLALVTFLGLSSPVPSSTLIQVLTASFVLCLSHSLAHGLGFAWWSKLMSAQRAPSTWWLVFFVWLISPIALFVQPLAPLVGIQGWLVPLSLLPSSFVQKGVAYLPFGLKIFIPDWWATALVQIAWSGLLWWLERKTILLQAEKREERREWLTVSHPVWGWLARLEGQICERLANPLVTLQIQQQSRFAPLKVAMDLGIVAIAFTLSLWLSAQIFPHPDLVRFANGVFARLPSLIGLAAWLAVAGAISSHDQKFALWLLGQKRVVESFVLSPLTKNQWKFGWWFPRVWLCFKATTPYAICLWLGFLLQPSAGHLLTASLVTVSLPAIAFALGLMGLAGSLMKQWEMFVALLFAFPVFTAFGVLAIMFALISNLWQHHALIWLGFFAIHLIIAAVSFLIFSRRIDFLRTPSGYERWLQIAEAKFRQAQKWKI
ncbi:MAG: hypothetical protein NZ937_05325 [Armatimonadetes bacterium]|nr:hypothetical protein [Armatimonadota bacterium]